MERPFPVWVGILILLTPPEWQRIQPVGTRGKALEAHSYSHLVTSYTTCGVLPTRTYWVWIFGGCAAGSGERGNQRSDRTEWKDGTVPPAQWLATLRLNFSNNIEGA
jgi:hypothetical protein